jgi:hypothetical protein
MKLLYYIVFVFLGLAIAIAVPKLVASNLVSRCYNRSFVVHS